jgi:hypothetical protein
MNAVWMAWTAPPMPTFSPSPVQLLGAWLVSEGLWEMVPAAAIWADHWRAMDVSCGCGVSCWMPRLERNWLVRARNWASSLPASACAAGAIAADSPAKTASAANHATTTRKSFTLMSGGSDVDALALTGLALKWPPGTSPGRHLYCLPP